ncbi:MAG: sulfatase-like hydrolase/transferase, partial [Verrucomicrobia bacterium]|nr:sulfatase-like hydrolase/transferase [Verrucomicrobiota bacterium]
MKLIVPWVLTLLITSLTGVSQSKPLRQAQDKPNIILMMADDMGMGDTSAFQDFTGNADDVQVHTPQMERLAQMGMRFTDAHTPSSRCSPTRYGLLTGRYPWRNRLKHWVLFGSQGDPMIEADRPTIASMLRDNGYKTAMFGKWHVGLRYRQSDGSPAAGWTDADLTQALHTTPLDHGFDYARFTSRSHASSGPNLNDGKPIKFRGPGHIDGRKVIGATGVGQETVIEGPNAYVLSELGSRHSDNAILFMEDHIGSMDTKDKPFFLYYPSNSNHAPYTPDEAINGVPVA